MGDKETAEVWRGRVAWHMQLIDVQIGHEALGFDYVFNGDDKPVA